MQRRRATRRRSPRCCSATTSSRSRSTSILLIVAAIAAMVLAQRKVARRHARPSSVAHDAAEAGAGRSRPSREDPDRLLPPARRRSCSRWAPSACWSERNALRHLHVGRAAAERGEPDARRVRADAQRPDAARCSRSSRWWWRRRRWSSASRSSCRSTGAAAASTSTTSGRCGGRTLTSHEPSVAVADPGAPAGGRDAQPVPRQAARAAGRACSRRSLVAASFGVSRRGRAAACSAVRAEERLAAAASVRLDLGRRVPGRRRPAAGPAVRHDDPGRHGDRRADPPLLDRLHGATTRATAGSSPT